MDNSEKYLDHPISRAPVKELDRIRNHSIPTRKETNSRKDSNDTKSYQSNNKYQQGNMIVPKVENLREVV